MTQKGLKRGLLLTALVFIVLIIGSKNYLYAIDWGLNIDNTSGARITAPPGATAEAELVQRDVAALWLSHGFSDYVDFKVQGSYTFTPERPLMLNLDLLRLGMNFPLSTGDIDITAGRFFFSEFTGKVLAHTLDGLRVRYSGTGLNLFFAAGFSGLLTKPLSTIILSNADEGDHGEGEVYFAPIRVIGLLELNFPELFLGQDINVAIAGQLDLRPEERLEYGEGKTHTLYTGLGWAGPLIPRVYWEGYGYFMAGTMVDRAILLSVMGGGGFQWFIEDSLNSRFSVRGVYTTGDKDADSPFYYPAGEDSISLSFLPISFSPVGMIYSPRLSNIFYGQAAFSMKPVWFFQGEVSYFALFRSAPSGISGGPAEAAVDPVDGSSLYLGSEIDLRLNFRPLSDLGIAVAYGLFLPGSGDIGALRENSSIIHRATVNLSFRL